jgi:hypothetical protein
MQTVYQARTARKPVFLSGLKQILISLSPTTMGQEMFIIIRVVVIALSAYAGSSFASIQFPDL